MFTVFWKKNDNMDMISELINLLKLIYNDFDLKKEDKKKIESKIRTREINLQLRKLELESELKTIDQSIKNAKENADDILKKIKGV